MVKGNSSLRNKKLHSSKPYDVSNSFVRKVTSRVTNLLPQPAWLSKWFTSSVDSDAHRRDNLNSHDCDSDDDDDDSDAITVQAPPVKRAKIPLNQRFPPDSFIISSVVNDQAASNQQAGTSGINQDDINTDRAVAGPSGINTRQLTSSTPNIQSTAMHLLAGTERKMNGDDRSESSESTSGCSSLVPQANRQSQASESVMNSLSGRRRSIDEKLNITCHLQSPRSLLSDRSHSRSPRLNSSVNRRRPSFNVSSFGSLLSGEDKSSAKNNVINSPFYAGRTTYGGASAYRPAKDRSFINSEAVSQKQYGVQVKPVNCVSDSLSSMSTTARRILEALEQFSTPVLDAKRIPLVSPTPSLSNKRKRPLDAGIQPGQSPRLPNSACGLTVPTVPDLLKMRHREKLQDSLEAARLIAASSYPSNFKQEYKLRFEDYDKTGKHSGKIRAKGKELEEDTVEAVNLPNISLPLTSLPKFDFVVPPASTTSTVTSTFKFASPITVTENARTCLPADNFTFSKPLSAVDNKDIILARKINCVDTFITNCPTKLGTVQFTSGSNSQSSDKGSRKLVLCKNSENEACFGIKPATQLETGSVMDILGKKSNSAGEAELKEVSSSSSMSLDKFKPSPGTWECGVCLIRNSSATTKCAACETSRTSAGLVSSTTVSTPSNPGLKCETSKELWECSSCHLQNPSSATVCSKCLVARTGQKPSESKEPQKPALSVPGFGNKFKPPSDTWECGTCLVRNPDSLKQCQACETKRPVLTAKSVPALSSKSTFGLGFGDKFKKPAGSWDCPDCMVRNNSDSLKCVACGKAKHGSETQSAMKFSFGIDKAGVSESDIASTNMQGFRFGESKIANASDFSFGVPQDHETKSSMMTTKSTPVLPAVSTEAVLFGDGFKKPSDTWNCPNCMVQNNNSLLKCVRCEGTKPSSELHSTMKFSFGTNKAGVSVKESSDMQNSIVSEGKVSSVPDGMPRIAETSISPAATGFNFGGNVATPLSACTVLKPADTSSPPQAGFSFGNTQLSKFQSPLSAENQKPSGAVQKKCWSSGTGDVPVNSKGGMEANSDVHREPATSIHTEQIKEKPEDRASKRVTFSLSESPYTNEEPHTSTKAVESAKPAFGFPAAPVSTTAAISSFSFTSSQPTFGSNTTTAALTTSNFGATADTVVTAVTTTTTVSNLFSFGSSTKPCVTFAGSSQPTASTTGSTLAFGTALKTVPTFSFGSAVGNKESVEITTSNKEMPSLVTLTSTAPSTLFGSFTTTTTVTPSLPSFCSPTTAPSFSLGARGTIPAFGIPNTSSSTSMANTAASSFSIASTPDFGTGFSSLHEQKPAMPAINKSTTSSSPFAFGSSLGQTTPFSFGSMQNEQGLANKGVFSFGAPATPAASSGFGFASSNQASSQVGPAFTFGSTPVITSSSEIPSFGTTVPATGAVFGASAPVFGASNLGSSNSATTTTTTTSSTPTYNFGSSNSQPTSSLFSFSASQTTGSANVPVQNFTNMTANFSFGQAQSPAQLSAQPIAPTFDPSIKPSFNFTKGETPNFTAAATGRQERRIKKAVRRTHPK